MAKYVRYNGLRESYYGSDDPDLLVKGKRYKVLRTEIHDWYTELVLVGMEDFRFDSMWFNEIKKETCLAKAIVYRNIYENLGRRMSLKKSQPDGSWEVITTSPVEEIREVACNMYIVETKNAVYVTQVTKRVMES